MTATAVVTQVVQRELHRQALTLHVVPMTSGWKVELRGWNGYEYSGPTLPDLADCLQLVTAWAMRHEAEWRAADARRLGVSVHRQRRLRASIDADERRAAAAYRARRQAVTSTTGE